MMEKTIQFNDLKNYCQDNYINYLNEYDNSFKQLYLIKDRFERKNKILAYLDTKENDYKIKIANPYFIGYGNPNSEILIIGKEKGFDIEESAQLYDESINNINQWNNPNIKYFENQILDKVNQLIPYPEQNRPHTWYFYEQVVKSLNDNVDNHFLSNCFITEMNYLPSKLSKGFKNVKKFPGYKSRMKMLQLEFFKSFKYVINTAKSYDTPNLNEKLFGVNHVENKHYGNSRIGDSFFYKNYSQNIRLVLTYQLSGLTSSAFGLNESVINEICVHLKKI